MKSVEDTCQPLSHAQHLVWLAQSVAKDVPLYNLVVTYAINGDLDPQRFVDSLEILVSASDILQSVIVDEESEHPSQKRVTSIAADCQLMSMASRQEMESWIADRCSVPLDPRKKMFDCVLVSLPDKTHVFYWCQHHISTDGFNIALLFNKLSSIYAQQSSDSPLEIDIPSYYDFLASQHELEGNERHEKIVAYWREKSALDVEESQYFGQAFDQSNAKVRIPIELNAAQKQAIEGILKQTGFKSIGRDMSLFALMATTMMVTGYRLHRKTELNLGFPSHGRQTPVDRETFGMFTAIGFLQLSLDNAISFRDLARKIMREAMQSFSHLESGVQTAQSQSAYSSSVNVLTSEIVEFAGMPVEVEWHYSGYSDSNSQLDLNVSDFSGCGEYALSVDLASSVFNKQHQQTYTGTFNTVLNALLDNPDQSVSGFEIVDEASRAALLKGAAGPKPDAIVPATLHGHFAEQAKRKPDAVALKEAGRQISYAQLNNLSNAIAAHLVQRGLKAGDAVGICFKRSMGMYSAMLGVMKAGAVMVPLDPTYPSERLAYMVKDSHAKLVLSNQATDPQFSVGDAQLVFVDNPLMLDGVADDNRFSSVLPDARSDAFYIMYTSGSTGLPKGVVGTHSATLNRFAWMWRRYPFQPGEVCCQKTALSFVDSVWELFGPLLQGVPIVVIPDETVLDIFAFVDVLESEQISRLVVVPSYLSVILDSDIDLAARLRTLEYCVVSGEPLPLHVARGFLHKLGHCQLLNLYGSTEVTADVTVDEVTHDKLAIKMPIGKPIDGVSIHIVDDQMKLMPAGAVGEICVAGSGLSGGYFERKELNDEKFVSSPFASDETDGLIFKTGDLGRLNDNGLIEHHGRRDAQLKIRGRRIESAEIEHAMLEYENVRSAVLYVGDSDRLFGFYVVSGGEEVDEAGMHEFLQARLPEYMIPQPVRIMQLPLLSNGKVNRGALGALTPKKSNKSEENFTPRTPTEETLVSLWKTTLGLAQVNIHADFFDLGGNSIAAMRIMVGARKLGIGLTLKEILEIGNVAEIGLEIDNNPVQHLIEGADQASLGVYSEDHDTLSIEELARRVPSVGDPENLKDIFPLTATQYGILYHLLLQGTQAPLYVIQIRCDLFGEMNIDLFKQAWDIVIERHDMLRSVVWHQGLDEPLQIVSKTGKLDCTVHDFTDQPLADAEAACDDVAATSITRPIMVDEQPMLRIHLGLVSEDVSHLIMEWHHILMDGWSVAVVSAEALMAYVALVKGKEFALPEVGRFKDHVSYLKAKDGEVEQEFWRGKLQGFKTPTPISRKKEQAADLFARGNINVFVDRESSKRLYAFARKCRVTPNTVVQAAWAFLLAKHNDTDDVMFGFAVTGRSSGIANFESTVGMFVNAMPMRIKCPSSTTLYDWMQEIQKDQMDLMHHENSSLIDIQKASDISTNAAMFDSLLVFQNTPNLSLSDDFLLEIRNRKIHENSPTPMTVEVFPDDLMEIQVMYIEEMFEDNAVNQIISHFTNIISSITLLDSSAFVSEVSMTSFAEIQEMTESFNQTQRDYPQEMHVADLVWQQASTHPDKMAASFGEQSLTYRELTARADVLAAHLQSRGIGINDVVAVCLNRDADLLTSLLAVQRAGAAFLPLDPDYPEHRINTILADADVALLITNSDVEAAFGEHAAPVLKLDVEWDAISQAVHGGSATPLTPVYPKGHDLAYVMYTSGTTGKPKGVRVTRWNMLNFLYSMQETPGLQQHDKLLAVTTVGFDIAMLELFLPLITGASVDVATSDLVSDGFRLVSHIKERGITVMQATPSLWRLLLAADWQGVAGDLPEFKALVGGETLPRDLAASLIPRVSSLWNMYGPTETTVWSTCEHITDAQGLISVGKPIANTQILILDGGDNFCPVSIPGELCIAGDGVSQGYVNQDEITEKKFIAHPYQPESDKRIYRTGDLAYWTEDGRIELLGRIDSQVKIRGFRIELAEIESVLNEIDGIDQAVVKLIKEKENEFLAAFMVPDADYEDVRPNELTLKEQLREKLPLYMVPSSFAFFEDLPLMQNGKIDRTSLPDLHGSAAEIAELANADVYDLPENQPATDTEKTLAEIWEKTLDQEQLSVNSNFFDLGGNSISAMRIMSACRSHDISLSILEIFELATIRECAKASDIANNIENPAQAQAQEPETTVDASEHSEGDMTRIAAMLRSVGG